MVHLRWNNRLGVPQRTSESSRVVTTCVALLSLHPASVIVLRKYQRPWHCGREGGGGEHRDKWWSGGEEALLGKEARYACTRTPRS